MRGRSGARRGSGRSKRNRKKKRSPSRRSGKIGRDRLRVTKPKHPSTNGQVERMNRTIKEATVKRYHYDDHAQLAAHLENFVAAYNFARRLTC